MFDFSTPISAVKMTKEDDYEISSYVPWGVVRPSPLGTSAQFVLLYQPWMMEDDEYGAVGVIIGREIQSTQIKPAPVALCPPQIPHGLTRAQTWVTMVGSQAIILTSVR
jgi:hypothetical protein